MESEAETRKKMKATKEHAKKWEETRENRVLILSIPASCSLSKFYNAECETASKVVCGCSNPFLLRLRF